MVSEEHSSGQERPASDLSGTDPDAAQDKEPLDPELVDQLRAYLEHVVCEAVKPPVYLAKHRVTELYMEPDVYRHSANVGDRNWGADLVDGEGLGTEPQRVPWQSECELALHAASPWRAAVLGPPGQGKSLLLMMLARHLAVAGLEALRASSPELDNVPLPVVVHLNELIDIPRDKGEPWNTFLQRALTSLLREHNPSIPDWGKAINYIVRSAETRSAWLLLDALDEVTDPSNLIKMLSTLENWDCHVILSSRPHAFEGTRLPFEVTKYDLAPFSPEQIEISLQAWLTDLELQEKVRAVLKRAGSINRMATNPLLLTLLCGFVERHGVRDEITRSELYDGVLHEILGLAADKRSAIDYKRAEAWLPLLVDLMWNSLWTNGGRPMAIGELVRFIERSDKSPDARDSVVASRTGKKTRQHAMALLEELEEKGILVPIDGRRTAYTVLHRSFTEYLAACALSDALEGRRPTLVIDPITGSTATASELWDVLDKKAWSPQWENVILFAAGQLRDPKRLLAILSAAGTDDYFRHRLALAALCLGEVSVQSREACAQPAKRIMSELFDYWWQQTVNPEGHYIRAFRNHQEALEQISQLDAADFYHVGLLDGLSQRLRGDYPANCAAARMVSFIGPSAASPGVLEALPDLLKREWWHAIRAVQSIGRAAETREISNTLLDMLKSEMEPRNRAEIVLTLRMLVEGPAKSDITKVLVEEKQFRRFSEVARVEGEIAAVTNRLTDIARELVDGSGYSAAFELVRTLGTSKYNALARQGLSLHTETTAEVQPTSIEDLERLLHHTNECVRAGAVWVLVAMGAAARIPEFDKLLLALLQSPTDAIRIVTLNSVELTKAASRSPQVLTWVLNCSLQRGLPESVQALSIIAGLGPTAVTHDYRLRLAEMLAGTEQHVKVALSILHELGSSASNTEVIDGLVRIMGSDASSANLAGAIWVIGTMGRAAARGDVAQCLVELSSHPDNLVRARVARAIRTIRTELPPPGTAAVIMRLLRDDEVGVVYNLARAVRDFSELEGRSDFLDEIPILFHQRNGYYIRAAMTIAEKLSPKAVIPNILGHLMHGSYYVEPAKPYWPVIIKLVNRGLRIFVKGSEPISDAYRATTVEELSRVDTASTASSGKSISARQPAAVDETVGKTGGGGGNVAAGNELSRIEPECIETPGKPTGTADELKSKAVEPRQDNLQAPEAVDLSADRHAKESPPPATAVAGTRSETDSSPSSGGATGSFAPREAAREESALTHLQVIKPQDPTELPRLMKIKHKIDPENTYLGESLAILRVFDRIDLLNRQSGESVLIRGESGVGKTRIASLIHSSSDRKEGPYRALQASDFFGHDVRFAKYEWEGHGPKTGVEGLNGISKLGQLEENRGGTIFIDEIADVPGWFQTSALRVLDKEEICPEGNGKHFFPDVRLILATDLALEEMISAGTFRGALLRRIGQRTISIPPLWERKEDVLLFVERWCKGYDIDPAFVAALLEYDWPGNVGELIDVLNLVLGEASKQHRGKGKTSLRADHLGSVAPVAMREVVGRWMAMEQTERESTANSIIDAALRKQGYETDLRNWGLDRRKAEILGVRAYALSRRKNKPG